MADRLARMYGTEEDKVNCPFYAKIGACRHGDRCGRVHNKPLFSVTVCLLHMYPNPMAAVMSSGGQLSREQEHEISERFTDFYEDAFLEVSRFGEVEDMYVADNLGDHLIGNVYVKYYDEEDAAKALASLNGRWYGGRQLSAEFCPVTEFRDARCRQFDERGCSRGGYCNFMHLKETDRAFHDELVLTQPFRGQVSKLPRDAHAPGERYGRDAGRGGGRDFGRGGDAGGAGYGGGRDSGRDSGGGYGGGVYSGSRDSGGYGGGGGRESSGYGGGGYGGGGRDSGGGYSRPAPSYGGGGYGGREERDYRSSGGAYGRDSRGGYDRDSRDDRDRDRDRDREYRDRDRERDREYRSDRDGDRSRDRGGEYHASNVPVAAPSPSAHIGAPTGGPSSGGLGHGGSGLGLGGSGLGLGGVRH